jgi:tetratricopeptide (TPR) repeat protein
MNKSESFSMLERYIRGELSDTENSKLEARIAGDTQLAEELKWLRMEKAVQDELVAIYLRKKMKQWERPSLGASSYKKIKWVLFIGIAVSLIMIFYHIVKSQEDAGRATSPIAPIALDKPDDALKSSDKADSPALQEALPAKSVAGGTKEEMDAVNSKKAFLLAQYYIPLGQIYDVLMGDAEEENTGFQNEIEAADRWYQAGKKTRALEIVKSLSEENPDAIYLQLMLGKLYFETGLYAQAATVFEALTQYPNKYEQEARWNHLLSCIAQHADVSACKNILNRILENPDHFKHKSALDLKRGLK